MHAVSSLDNDLVLHNVYHASSHLQFDEQRMPIFSSHPLFSHEINSCCGPLRLNQRSTEDTINLLSTCQHSFTLLPICIEKWFNESPYSYC